MDVVSLGKALSIDELEPGTLAAFHQDGTAIGRRCRFDGVMLVLAPATNVHRFNFRAPNHVHPRAVFAFQGFSIVPDHSKISCGFSRDMPLGTLFSRGDNFWIAARYSAQSNLVYVDVKSGEMISNLEWGGSETVSFSAWRIAGKVLGTYVDLMSFGPDA